jgi:glucose-6-phosphate isomerase
MKLNINGIFGFIDEDEFYSSGNIVKEAANSLYEKTAPGSQFLGWMNLGTYTTDEEIKKINRAAERLRKNSEVVVVTGIGGSYLGSKAVIEALGNNFSCLKKDSGNPLILFAGQNISEDYLADLLDVLKDKDYSVIVISKSGTTLEPAVAFRLLREDIIKRYGKDEAMRRIIAITDKEKGALKLLAQSEGYETFIIPDDIGGRYSVLTPVGLLPIAVAGFNISDILRGAGNMEVLLKNTSELISNPAYAYALARNKLYQSGKVIELLSNFIPSLHFFAEWWKQLYGESEGKEGKGIFPTSVDLTTDLHSMGQWIQEGSRNIFETCLWVKKTKQVLTIPESEKNLDGLNYLSGKRISFINEKAMRGTLQAHKEGGVPVIEIELDELNEFEIGRAIYFFELSCAISGLLLGVNPFNQPGVEAYKKKMFALLGKS